MPILIIYQQTKHKYSISQNKKHTTKRILNFFEKKKQEIEKARVQI